MTTVKSPRLSLCSCSLNNNVTYFTILLKTLIQINLFEDIDVIA